jgi:uncharacterized membrane protein YgcG
MDAMSAASSHGAARLRRSVAALAMMALLSAALAAPGSVAAASPTNLRSQLTDDVGALSGSGRDEVATALKTLLDGSRVQLWVWFTDTTGGMTAADFAGATAEASSLGGTDLLLVLAMSDHAYGYSRPAGFPLSNADLERLLSDVMEPSLRDGDNAGAITGFAGALAEAMAGPGPTTVPTTVPSAGPTEPPGDGSSSGSGGGGSAILLIVIVLLAIGAGWFFFIRRRPGTTAGSAGGAPADPLAKMNDADLNAEANRLLLATDDGVKDSEQELGFAEAQFGETEAAPFQAAIAASKGDLKAAFEIRQKLDDEVAEDKPTRRGMLVELIGRCQKAQARLDAETERFEALRAFEREAPGILAALPATMDAVEARFPAVETTMTHLQDYADSSWQAVATNLDEARGRAAAARAAVVQGQAATTASDSPRVAAATRVGQTAAAQAGAFLDAIEHLSGELDLARDHVSTEIAAAEADLARARAAADTAPVDPTIGARITEAEGLLADARRDIGHPKPDVAAAYAKARQANQIGDEVLAGIRSAAEQRAAIAARLQTSIRGAQATVTRATDYVANHRGGVGGDARTRIAEASRHLDLAVASGATDPTAGIQEAETATRLANEALALAQHDYERYDDPWHGRPQGGGGSGGGSDVAGAIIGSIIGSILSGGGGGGRGGGGGFPMGGGFPGGFPGGGGGGGWGGGGGGGGRSSGGGRW